MRARLCLGWLVGAILVVGCETNQPIRQDQQSISLSFNASNAAVQEIWTWTVFEDSNDDGFADDVNGDGMPDEFLWCDPQPRYVFGAQMPWSFSVQVDKVLSGEVESITIARETEPNKSFATYDTGPGANNLEPKDALLVTNRTGYCTFNEDILCNPDNLLTTICSENQAGTCVASGVCSGDASVECEPDSPSSTLCENMGLGTCNNVLVVRTFRFRGERIGISGANQDVLAAVPNIVAVTDPVAALDRGPTGGICPGNDLGESNIGGNDIPWSFPVDKGETIIVQARRFNLLPDGFAFGASIPEISPTVVYVRVAADPVKAEMFVDGAPAGFTGTDATTIGDPESFIDFFYTSK